MEISNLGFIRGFPSCLGPVHLHKEQTYKKYMHILLTRDNEMMVSAILVSSPSLRGRTML